MEAELVHVRPAPGLRVIDPATRQPLPPEGASVVRSGYWTRRINQGDVLVAPQESSTASAEPA